VDNRDWIFLCFIIFFVGVVVGFVVYNIFANAMPSYCLRYVEPVKSSVPLCSHPLYNDSQNVYYCSLDDLGVYNVS